MKNNNNTHGSCKNEIIYLVLTDVINSSSQGGLKWRAESFKKQLKCLLENDNSFALKSVGDALFVIYSINNGHDEANIAKAILANVWDAFRANKGLPIRCAIHRIHGHCRGDKIAKALNCLNTRGDIDYLKTTLAKDIFGNEVNKAWRILSLVRESAVLVSEDVVKIITKAIWENPSIKTNKDSSEIRALEGKDIQFEYGSRTFTIHSPVPILYMKGIKLQNKSPEKDYCLVWHLGNPDSPPALAHEFKQLQALRQIVVDAGSAIELPAQRDELTKVAFRKLLEPPTEMQLSDEAKNDFNIKRRFYFDMVWKVIERFDVCRISFTRRAIDSSHDFRERLRSLLERTSHKSARRNRNRVSYEIQGEDGNIIIESSKTAITSARYNNSDNKQTRSFTSLLVFTSCPDQKYSDIIRKLLSSDKPTKGYMTCMPQTTELYNAAIINEGSVSADVPSSENTVPVYSDGKYLMVMFQVCSKDIHDAEKESALFSDCVAIKGTEVMMYGLTSGLIDGFVIYKIMDKDKEWDEVLEQLFIEYMVQGQNGIFGKTYPVSIYILEALSVYPPLKKNIRYLIDIHKANSKEREDEC